MIRFYMGGTTDAKDGIEISSGDMLNPIIADGFYPAVGATVTKTIPLHVRADEGETWHDVILGIIDTINTTTVGNSVKFSLNGNKFIGSALGQWYFGYHTRLPWFATLGDTNRLVTLVVSVSGSENNTPDTSCKLVAFNGWEET